MMNTINAPCVRPVVTVVLQFVLLAVSVAAQTPSPTAVQFEPYPLGTLEFDYQYDDLRTEMGRVEVTRVIRGEIRLVEVNPTVGVHWCKGQFVESVFFDVVGEGTLHGTQSERTVDPSGTVDCRMEGATFTVAVKIRGKTWWRPNELDCSDETLSVSFEAVHNHDLRGTMRCTLPTGQVIDQPVEPRRSRGKTAATIYNTGLEPLSETIEFQLFDGMFFQQIITSGGSTRNEKITLRQPHPEHPDLTKPSLRYESPPPDPTQVRHAIVGPPLSQVPYGIPTRK